MKLYAVLSQAMFAICSITVYNDIGEGLLLVAYTIAWITHSNSTFFTMMNIKYVHNML